MNLIKLSLILAFFCLVSFLVQAQNVKPKFKKLIYVVYRPTLSDQKKTIRIEDYLEIDSNGMFHNVTNRYDDYYGDHLSYKGRMWDTTYMIPDSIVVKLNQVFNGSKKLMDHIETYTFPKGSFFAGPLYFLSYTSNDNKADNLVIPSSSFLDDELRDILDKFWHLPSANIKQNVKVYRNKLLEAEVSKHHYTCKYVPKIVEPPRVMLLEKN